MLYDDFGKARPNQTHEVLARLEVDGWAQPVAVGAARLKVLISQNIDDLHRIAGIPG